MSRSGAKVAAARRGFTLLEVVVALAIAGLILMSARAMMEVVAATASITDRAARANDAAANAERRLRLLVARSWAGERAEWAFRGNSDSLAFASWCDVPGGWLERCQVSLVIIRHGGDAAVLAMTEAGTAPVIIRELTRPIGLRYLVPSDTGASWVTAWESITTPPPAIGVMSKADTTILRVGERG